MSHVSSTSNSSYAYRGTLSRLDANGDGILSREEREADERPGILEADAIANSNRNGAMGSLIAKLMQLPGGGATLTNTSPEANNANDFGLLAPMDAYNSTYGQYDTDSMVA
ncbi:hypothetical protein PY650_02145 [Rhizobium calliandrae]|uniref:EF-hand domain-containing protein n=1 Tax=Rhizobium calliandrae TaxID=1312182 RepID=A0ABT7K798_9HYPH|nr:hypothetical protein [Rhizobium calliandrae]MDL2404473.1 hypothetical protein [Rhizobium calliandrae]